MDKYLQTGIKAIIDEHPAVADILERYHIACVPCTVGTCSLADVTKFHHLPLQSRAQMMFEIEQALYPDRDVPPPEVLSDEEPPSPPEHSLSPPVRQLVEEHDWIKRMLVTLPAVLDDGERAGAVDAELMTAILDFIRGYADRFHHLKEENILFDYADPEEALVKVIYQDHDTARGCVRAASDALAGGDLATLCESLRHYRELLTEHIDKEDGVLYPYIDRGLTTSQVGELFRRFAEAEAKLEADVPDRYLRFVEGLEQRHGGGQPCVETQEQEQEQATTP